jgi:hypothetical protein
MERSIKSQIPSTKLQINPKYQTSNSKHLTKGKQDSQVTNTKLQINLKLQIPNLLKAIVFLFGILNFGHCDLFVFWDLLFGISTNSITP